MTDNEKFFAQFESRIFDECQTTQDFIDAYEDLKVYVHEHHVECWESKAYRESGAAEMLAMVTQRYRKEQETKESKEKSND